MTEIWKDIVDYKGLYQASNLGRIKSLDKKDAMGRLVKGKIMKPATRKDGYLQITLHKDKKATKFLVHRLIAEIFIENKQNLKEINHKDENKQNNNISNLEWCSRKYNVNYGEANKKRRYKLLNKRGKKIAQYDKKGNLLNMFLSLSQATRDTKVNKAHISECCNKYRKTAGGYKWECIN